MRTTLGRVGAFSFLLGPATMRRGLLLSLGILLVPIMIGAPGVSPADAQTAKERKLITRIAPEYPETLKRDFIGGFVHIRAAVAPNGTVESTQLLGGNPILGEAAMKAVKQWKYSPADSREELEVWVEFNPRR
jgi:TonB family protein